MITDSDVGRLLAVRTPGRSVLSLYMRVPPDPAALRELPARAHAMLTVAMGTGGGRDGSFGTAEAGGSRPEGAVWPVEDEQRARKLLELHGPEWLGQTAALFVADKAGLSQAFSLPCELPDRALLASRPHIRPLLVAQQRCPAHLVAVLDRENARLLRVSGDEVQTAAAVTELERQPFRSTADLIGHAMAARGCEPLVIGGHQETIAQFTALLPGAVRERLAGSFVVDPDTMTPARIRELARPVIADWVGMHEQRVAMDMREGEGPHDPLTVSGLNRCLDAVNSHAVDLLAVPVGGVIGGYVCERCGALGAAVTGCPDGPAESRWVPDLFEEMVTKTIGDGGHIEALADPPGDVAAHLRFPVVQSSGR
jgi:hypothetical protein